MAKETGCVRMAVFDV